MVSHDAAMLNHTDEVVVAAKLNPIEPFREGYHNYHHNGKSQQGYKNGTLAVKQVDTFYKNSQYGQMDGVEK